MSRKVFEKLKLAANAAKTSLFKSKHPQEGKGAPIREDGNKDGRDNQSSFKAFTNLAQEKMKSLNSPYLNTMGEKLRQLDPSSKLKDMGIKDSLKGTAQSLKQGSQGIVDSLKEQTSRLSDKVKGTKKTLSSGLDRLVPSLTQEDKQPNSHPFQLGQDKQDSKQQQLMKWITNRMHNSQANFKALEDTIHKELKKNATSRFGMVQKILQKLYWKMAILLFFIFFAYALGSSIPREMRIYYAERKQDQQEKAGKQAKA